MRSVFGRRLTIAIAKCSGTLAVGSGHPCRIGLAFDSARALRYNLNADR